MILCFYFSKNHSDKVNKYIQLTYVFSTGPKGHSKEKYFTLSKCKVINAVYATLNFSSTYIFIKYTKRLECLGQIFVFTQSQSYNSGSSFDFYNAKSDLITKQIIINSIYMELNNELYFVAEGFQKKINISFFFDIFGVISSGFPILMQSILPDISRIVISASYHFPIN